MWQEIGLFFGRKKLKEGKREGMVNVYVPRLNMLEKATKVIRYSKVVAFFFIFVSRTKRQEGEAFFFSSS
jgi:hypothetical protein